MKRPFSFQELLFSTSICHFFKLKQGKMQRHRNTNKIRNAVLEVAGFLFTLHRLHCFLQLSHSNSYCLLVSPILSFSEFSLGLITLTYPLLLSPLLFLTSLTPCPSFSSCPNLGFGNHSLRESNDKEGTFCFLF